MIRRYLTRFDDVIFHSYDMSVSLSLVDEIRRALLNHDFKFLLDATTYLIVMYGSARELVRAFILESMRYFRFPHKTIENLLHTIDKKSSKIHATPVQPPLLSERSHFFMSRSSWTNSYECLTRNSDKPYFKESPILNAYSGVLCYLLWQREKVRERAKLGLTSSLELWLAEAISYFNTLYAAPGIWDVPLFIHLQLLTKEKKDYSSALKKAEENLKTNEQDLNAWIALAEFYIFLETNESVLFDSDTLVKALTRIHYFDPSNHLMIDLCQQTGISEESSNFIVAVSMAYLDYPCNKLEYLMWECLYGALTELSNKGFECVLTQEWEHRKTWWRPLHFSLVELGVKFRTNPMLYCYKALVLNTLEWGEGCPYAMKAKTLLSELGDIDYRLECYAKLDNLTIEDFGTEDFEDFEEDTSCVVFDFSNDLTEMAEEIDMTEDVELDPIPLAERTQFFEQEDLASYCYISDQCLMKQELERLYYLRGFRGVEELESNSKKHKSDTDCESEHSDSS